MTAPVYAGWPEPRLLDAPPQPVFAVDLLPDWPRASVAEIARFPRITITATRATRARGPLQGAPVYRYHLAAAAQSTGAAAGPFLTSGSIGARVDPVRH